MKKEHEQIVNGFIEDVWNGFRLDAMQNYLHPDFSDHSLPGGLQNSRCLAAYLGEIRKNLNHHTKIEKFHFDDNFVIIDVKVTLSAIHDPEDEQYRDRPDEIIKGRKVLAIFDRLIIGHWEFLECSKQIFSPVS